MTQPNIHKSEDRANIEIDITDDHEWVERIAKTANEICDDPDNNRIKRNGQHNGLTSLMMLEAIEHPNDIPSKLKPVFRKILDETRTKKENLERSLQ